MTTGAEETISGFVLAGGLSSRMGRDKALVEYGGRPLLTIALSKLATVVSEPKIVGSRDDLQQFGPVIPDRHPGIGPLAGLEAALVHSSSELNLFLPIDLPLIPTSFLHCLISRALCTGAAATIPLLNGRMQPLVAVYRRSLLPALQTAILREQRKVVNVITAARDLPGGLDCFYVEALALQESDWPYVWFRNMNRPEDLV